MRVLSERSKILIQRMNGSGWLIALHEKSWEPGKDLFDKVLTTNFTEGFPKRTRTKTLFIFDLVLF